MMDRPAKGLAQNKDVKEFHLGMSSKGRTSFRDRKSYRRRKRCH
jgi:branched-chain amino acid transport system ATP-binding protein